MKTLDYIVKLTTTPSPTGYTTAIMNYIQSELESFGYQASKTPKGGILVTVPGTNVDQHRMVTAHLDTLGAMVRAIKADGRLKMDLVGGFWLSLYRRGKLPTYEHPKFLIMHLNIQKKKL